MIQQAKKEPKLRLAQQNSLPLDGQSRKAAYKALFEDKVRAELSLLEEKWKLAKMWVNHNATDLTPISSFQEYSKEGEGLSSQCVRSPIKSPTKHQTKKLLFFKPKLFNYRLSKGYNSPTASREATKSVFLPEIQRSAKFDYGKLNRLVTPESQFSQQEANKTETTENSPQKQDFYLSKGIKKSYKLMDRKQNLCSEMKKNTYQSYQKLKESAISPSDSLVREETKLTTEQQVIRMVLKKDSCESNKPHYINIPKICFSKSRILFKRRKATIPSSTVKV